MGHWARVALSGSNAHFRTLTSSALTSTQSVHTAVVTYDTSVGFASSLSFTRTGSYGFMGTPGQHFPFQGDVFLSASGTTTTRSINMGANRDTPGSASLITTKTGVEDDLDFYVKIIANPQVDLQNGNSAHILSKKNVKCIITGSFPNGISASLPSLPLTRSISPPIGITGAGLSFGFVNPAAVVNNELGTKFSSSAAQVYRAQFPKNILGDDGSSVHLRSKIRGVKIHVTCSLNNPVTSEQQPTLQLGIADYLPGGQSSAAVLASQFLNKQSITILTSATASYSAFFPFQSEGVFQRVGSINASNYTEDQPNTQLGAISHVLIRSQNNPANREINLEGMQIEYFTIPDYPFYGGDFGAPLFSANHTASGEFVIERFIPAFSGASNKGFFVTFSPKKSGTVEMPFIGPTTVGANELKYKTLVQPPFPDLQTSFLAFSSSTRKLKTNIKPINSSLINAFDNLKPVTYLPNSEENNTNAIPVGGFIAEDCANAHPSFAIWNESSPIDIDDRAILSAAVAKLQTLNKELNNI